MSRDGYFPKILQSVHSRYGTFHVAAIVGVTLIVILSSLGAIPFLGYAASFGALLVFALVNLSLIKLRKTQPHMDRPFKTPLYPITPIFGVILSLVMLIVPVLFGDGNALDAFVSAIGLAAVVVGSYYLRMAGRFRIQIALGGIGIGTGVSILAVTLMNLTGLATPVFPFIPSYIQLFFSVVLIISGFFNFNAHSRKRNQENNKQGLATKLGLT